MIGYYFIQCNPVNEQISLQYHFRARWLLLINQNIYLINPTHKSPILREFQMAEIEHFHDPIATDHPKFYMVEDLEIPLYTASAQMSGQLATKFTIKSAVQQVHKWLYNKWFIIRDL